MRVKQSKRRDQCVTVKSKVDKNMYKVRLVDSNAVLSCTKGVILLTILCQTIISCFLSLNNCVRLLLDSVALREFR